MLPAELFDPATNTWTQVASVAEPRTYHSIALLLPDATVFAGGGGLCGTACLQNHFNAQIYSPPYLFEEDGGGLATRPVIQSLSASVLKPGASLTVFMETSAAEEEGCDFQFSLVRAGSATHTVNTDQRRVPLEAEVGEGEGEYVMTLPADGGILLPGLWMLFAIDEAGVPSVSKQIKIQVV